MAFFVQTSCAETTGTVRTEHIIIIYEGSLGNAAQKIAEQYEEIKGELEENLTWKFHFTPTILLIENHTRFQQLAGGQSVVAFAVPQKKLAVIDYSKVQIRPYTARAVLKHELCHLLLHSHIRQGNLPRWIDEGIAQWVSDGVAEIITNNRRSVLREAILSGNLIGMRELSKGFPRSEKSILLAYEQSKAFVEFIAGTFGKKVMLDLLRYLKEGHEIDAAISKSLSMSLDELESKWHEHIRIKTTWLTYLAANVHEILFIFGALAVIYGFIKLTVRKRLYQDKEDDVLTNS